MELTVSPRQTTRDYAVARYELGPGPFVDLSRGTGRENGDASGENGDGSVLFGWAQQVPIWLARVRAALARSAAGALARWRVGEDAREQRGRTDIERVVERARRSGALAGELGQVE